MSKDEKMSYKGFGFRLHSETYKLLKVIKEIDGKSWNLFLYDVIRFYVNGNKCLYREKVFKPIYYKYLKDNCEECGVENGYKQGKYLCVHHVDGDITNNKEENLKTLCQKCHGSQYPR